MATSRKNEVSNYSCLACGEHSDDDFSFCKGCGREGTSIVNYKIDKDRETRRRAKPASEVLQERYEPISTGRPAWDEALGGGLVRPSSVMVHGPKGTGKTTAMLQIATTVARALNGPALYGTAEMSESLLRHYAERGNVNLSNLYISDAGDAENLLDDIEEIQPSVTVWDSVQAFSIQDLTGELALRAVVNDAIKINKKRKSIVLLVSQNTKDNDYLGPSEFGHLVDVIVHLSRNKKNHLLIECPEKNRFVKTPTQGIEE